MQIDPRAASRNLRRLMAENGLTVRDIQDHLGLESSQAVYKWLTGRNLPTTRHLYALSRILHTTMENILTDNGQDVPVSRRKPVCHCPWNISISPMCITHHLAASRAACS